MPQREARFSVNAPPHELWSFLRDFRALCTCIPGVEGIEVLDAPAFGVQYHPESSPGPHDARALFGRFVAMMERAA